MPLSARLRDLGPTILGLLAAATAASPAQQIPLDPYAPVHSMGLPLRRAPYVGVAAVGSDVQGEFGLGGRAFLGYRRELIQPVVGALGVTLEGYAGFVGSEAEGGGRAFASIRALRLQFGLDAWAQDPWPPDFVLTLEDPILRGGLLGRGASVRLEWVPARSHLGLGLSFPLLQPWIGKTRPQRIGLEVPPHPRLQSWAPPGDSVLASALEGLRTSATTIDELTTPFIEAQLETNREWMSAVEERIGRMRLTDQEFPQGHTYPAEVAAYHRRFRRLFAAALGTDGGAVDPIADAARRVLLEEVVIPANRHFGMLRGDGVFTALRARAAARFGVWTDTAAWGPADRREAVFTAFRGLLEVVGAVERGARQRWGDSRLIWLPFQLALRPEEHDGQQEIDDLIERLLGDPLLAGNDYQYLVNEAFSQELISSLHEAQDYHVLWVHDFPGVAPDGGVDEVAQRVVLGYLDALTQRVREFDGSRALPVFMIFLDQWYFDGRKGRWWMGLLQDPLGRELTLPREARALQHEVRSSQRALRDAVAQSPALQTQAATRGRRWLHRYVKVHVNVTYPGDPTFAGRLPAPQLPLVFADDYMRDHKKVVFYDLTEEDPARGAALFTGEGVGENYENAIWEDRSLLVRGPAALALKREARALLLAQGFREHQIPPPLRARPFAADYWPKVDSLIAAGWTSRIVQVHSGTGYDRKYASTLKAALYNLMPAGSRILAPDSQWSSFFWAGMLVGTALRGCKVFVIAPRTVNAPYGAAVVQNVLTHDVLEGYVQLRQLLAQAFAASGGGLWVGLYGQDVGTRSLGDRYGAVIRGMLSPAFPRQAFPFQPVTYDRLTDVPFLRLLLARASQGQPASADRVAPDSGGTQRFPKLHLKSQLFASAQGIERVLADPFWFDVAYKYVRARVREVAADSSRAAAGTLGPELLEPIERTLWRAPPAARAKDVFYLTVGSQNQNDRSLLLDGEVLSLVAGVECLATLIDFVAIAARSTWVETTAELDALIPPQSRRQVRRARTLRSLF